MAEAVRSQGCVADSIDYQGITDPTARVKKLIASCVNLNGPLILVGSSMGGHVATAAAEQVNAVGLFVLAPAYFMPEFKGLTPAPPNVPLEIVHGWHDDVVPIENSVRFAKDCAATLHIVDGDHRLTDNIDDINFYLLRFIDRFS